MRKVILLFMLMACSAFSALAQSFTLSGSEHEIVNGVYTFMGVNERSQPLYTHPSSQGQYEIFYDNNGTWWLGTDKGLSGGTQYYKASGTAAEIPLSGWVNDKGAAAPVALVADPHNAEILAARNAAPVLIKGLGDNNPTQTFEVAHVTATEQVIVPENAQVVGNTAARGVNNIYYVTNLRISDYYIQSDDNDCSFDGENPDPRYRIQTNYGYDNVLNPGDDKSCGWGGIAAYGPAKNITPTFYNNSIPLTAATPFNILLNIDAWEEDGCDDDDTDNDPGDNTYDDDCFNDDDYPASISGYILTLNTSNVYLGYNSRVISWSGNGVTYGIEVSFEVALQDRLVTVYADANQSGNIQQFGVGEYAYASLGSGVGNNAISSMTIASGYKVTTYNTANFTGFPVIYRNTVNYVGGMNDKISSMKIEYEGASPPTDGKTLLIYFNGSGKDIKFQLSRNASKIKADEMIFIKGVGGEEGPSSAFITTIGVTSYLPNPGGTYFGYNANNFAFEEGELLYDYFELPSTYSSHVNVFKNTNANAAPNSYLFGVDMEYDGTVAEGYEDEDSYTAASNVLRVLKRYNLRGYDTILISGHSRGSAVGISSLLYGIKKAVTNTGFYGFEDIVADVFGNANIINVLALDPVAGADVAGFRNDYHMGDTWQTNDIYTWFKAQYPSSNFSEIYANGAKQREYNVLPEGGTPFFWEKTFDPSPNYLTNSPANNVQRYWLGYRHSSMESNDEPLSRSYNAIGADLPWLHTVEMENAALHNQTLFRNNTHWFNKFRKSDMDGWLGALRLDGCTLPPYVPIRGGYLNAPDDDLQMQHFHGTRHTNFDNIGGTSVNMDAFVGNNNIEFGCSGNYPPPTAPGTYTADNSVTDADGWTHYCTCKGELLLGIKVASGDPTPAPSEVSLVVPSGYAATAVPANTGFITNPNGAAVMNRKWSINSTAMAGTTVSIRDYFNNAYVGALSNTLGQTVDTTKMWFYKSSHAPTVPIANIPSASADVYTNGTTPSLNKWVLGRKERSIYAEYLVNNFIFGSGGGGAAINGDGPICATPLVYNITGIGNYCTTNTIPPIGLSNSQNNVNYQLFLDGNAVGSPVAGTGSAISFGNTTITGTYTVVASTPIGECKANMSSSGTVTISVSPTLYNVTSTPNGAGIIVGLDNSQVGISYYMWRNGVLMIDVPYISGTGSALSFTAYPQTLPGTHTITASIGYCTHVPMTGSAVLICPTATTLHVNAAVATSGNGSTFATAYKTLSEALSIAHSCNSVTTIKVVAGTYKPTKKPYNSGVAITTTDDRDMTFHIRDGLTIEGGYDATGTRNITTNVTTLSGDIGVVGDATDNAYHVVIATSSVGFNIDGFTITGGKANGSSFIFINGSLYYQNSGGGILSVNGTNTLSNNTVSDNFADNEGGGAYLVGGINTVNNNIFSDNTSNNGGGICTYSYFGTNTLTNNTIVNNTANNGGGIYTYEGINTISNNILWSNKKGSDATIQGADYYSYGDNRNTFSNNLLQLSGSNYPLVNQSNWWNPVSTTYAIGENAAGNIFAQDPNFVDAATNNLQLGACSPATDAGTNTLPSSGGGGSAPALDRAGNAIFNTTKDMGAYERQTELCPVYANAGNGCQTLTMDNVTGNQWFYFNNNKGRIAAINPNGQNLGTVTVEVNDGTAPLTRGTSKFLGRSVNINSTTAPTANYTLRLYYYDAELTEYNTATNGTFALTDFNVAWASGGTNGTGCDLNAYASSATSNGLIAKADVTEADYGLPSSGGAGGGSGFYLEMALNHFTAFAATTSSSPNPLPVKLLTFAAHKEKSAHRLNWTTATEQNASHFEVQYSATGNDFSTIGTVRAAGNTNTPQYYTFDNKNISTGIHYYRLKMIDFDGSFEYSNTIIIKEDGTQITITAFPNPSENGIFTLQGKTFERTNAVVTNVLGQTIPTTIQNNQLNLSTLPAGVYFVRIAGENNTISVVKL